MTTPAQQRADSEDHNARIRTAQAKFGIGKKPATIPEIDRAPKPSSKGSCVRRRAGLPSSSKVIKANATATATSERNARRAAIRKVNADKHADYLKEIQEQVATEVVDEVLTSEVKS